MTGNDVDRLALTFHRTFPFSAPSVSRVLEVAGQLGESLTTSTLRDRTGMGTVFVEAMPRYARGAGLIRFGSYLPTRLGEMVAQHDANLAQTATLWLIHYHLSAPHGPGPEYWSHLVTHHLPLGREVSTEELRTAVRNLQTQRVGKAPPENSVKSSVSAFTSSYTKPDGLGRLGLLQETFRRGAGGKTFLVSGPQMPPPVVVGYALADYWEAKYPDRKTINLMDLAADSGFVRLMWTDQAYLESALDALRRAGVLDLFRVAPPYQVVRLWSDKADLLERLYQ